MPKALKDKVIEIAIDNRVFKCSGRTVDMLILRRLESILGLFTAFTILKENEQYRF